MDINRDPWEHAVICNYYDQQLFSNMKSELENLARKLKTKYASQTKQIVLTLDKESQCFVCGNLKIIKPLPHTKTCIESLNIKSDDLKHFSYHRPFENLKLKTNINICFDDMNYPIHDDVSYKILTNVIFVGPDVSHGTALYDKDKNYIKEIDWVTNTSLIFPPKDSVTWHSYKSLSNSYRITINQFLVK